jgi:hypothetical protein
VVSTLVDAKATAPAPAVANVPPPTAPAIGELLKPEALRRILEDRAIVTDAGLDDVPEKKDVRRYHYYASMLVHASRTRTRECLTDYRAYAKMVPYIDRADFIRPPDLIEIQGGIWKFKLRSSVQFDDRGEGWIHYRIVAGHFRGLSGDLFFESRGEKGTLVYMRGEQFGTDWPPKFVITKGAEIVFAFTAKRMRSYVEEDVTPTGPTGGTSGSEIPQPRSHL